MSKLITIVITLLISINAFSYSGHYIVPGGNKYEIENINLNITDSIIKSINYNLPKELFLDNYLTELIHQGQSPSSKFESTESLAKCALDIDAKELICFIEFKEHFKRKLDENADKIKSFITRSHSPEKANLLIHSFALFRSEPIGFLKIYFDY
jgi:hypothetical protein